MPDCTITELQTHIKNTDITITDVSRMRYSGGVMNLVDIDGKYGISVDDIWTSYWTKKWKQLSENDFAEWVKPKIIKYVMSVDPDSYFSITDRT